MKTIKVGAINWDIPGCQDIQSYYIGTYILSILNNLSNKYKYEYITNPYEEKCDVVIYSIWGEITNLKKCKGNPKFIFWTHEYLCAGGADFICIKFGDNSNINYKYSDYIFNFYKQNNYSMSFNDNDEYNLYYPYWLVEYEFSINLWKRSIKNNYRNISNKSKFCVFCSSHDVYYESNIRVELVKQLCKYKFVSCCGKGLHNTGNFYLPFDYDKAQDYCKDYKFYISFENAKSNNQTNYITEKLLFGWRYSCIPLYWGDNRNLQYFNKNAFIDLSNCNQNEMIQKIIDLDNDNERSQYILNQYLFADKNINYKNMFDEQLIKFIENVINN